MPPSTPPAPLDLSGVEPGILSTFPTLSHDIEIVGCPTCHTDDANFVQTTPQRTFSPFYDRELDARGNRIDTSNATGVVVVPPFGALQ